LVFFSLAFFVSVSLLVFLLCLNQQPATTTKFWSYYCVLFSSRVGVRVRFRFSIWFVNDNARRIYATFRCHCAVPGWPAGDLYTG